MAAWVRTALAGAPCSGQIRRIASKVPVLAAAGEDKSKCSERSLNCRCVVHCCGGQRAVLCSKALAQWPRKTSSQLMQSSSCSGRHRISWAPSLMLLCKLALDCCSAHLFGRRAADSVDGRQGAASLWFILLAITLGVVVCLQTGVAGRQGHLSYVSHMYAMGHAQVGRTRVMQGHTNNDREPSKQHVTDWLS